MANTTVKDPHKTSSGRWQALLICLVAGFMTLLDVSIANVALPSIERGLRMSPGQLQWAVVGYALAFGLTLIPAGRLGDEYGRKKLFLSGLSLFALTAIVCGAAPNAAVLVVGRICRGAAAGILAPQVIGLIQQMYSGPSRGKAFGYYGATVGLSTAIGPLLGGVILQVFGAAEGWRFVFYLSVPVVLIALAVGARALPPDPQCRARRRLDLIGLLLLGLGVLGVLLPLLNGAPSLGQPGAWMFVFGVAWLALFVRWQRRLDARGRQPLVSPKLLRIHGYPLGVTIATVFFAGFTSVFLVITMFLQQGLGYSALQAAGSTLVFTFASAGSAILSGRLVPRFGRRIVVLGSAIATLGLTALAVVAYRWTGPDSALVLAVPLLVAGCGCGLVISANQTLTLHMIPRASAGMAAGVYESGQRIGTALGTALANALYFGALAATDSDFHAAAGSGLASPAALVGLACVIGLIELARSKHVRTRCAPKKHIDLLGGPQGRENSP
jgi:EmrB/QacA subfamily drug resistance transporter